MAVLVEAVKEQQGELAAQQARVNTLEARLAEIEALLLTGGRLPGVFAHR